MVMQRKAWVLAHDDAPGARRRMLRSPNPGARRSTADRSPMEGALDANTAGAVALLAQVSAAEVARVWSELREECTVAAARCGHRQIKCLLGHYGLRLSHSRSFHPGKELPDVGLLPDRWLRQGTGAGWGWRILFRHDQTLVVVYPHHENVTRLRAGALRPHPPWYIAVRNVAPAVKQRFQSRFLS